MMSVGLGMFLLLPVSWRTSEAGSAAIVWLTFAISLAMTLPLAALSFGLIERKANVFGQSLPALSTKRHQSHHSRWIKLPVAR